MTYRYDHLHLRSADAERAAGFYVATFGAREVRREAVPAGVRVVLDLAGLTLFVEQAPSTIGPAANPPHLGIEHFGLAVDDMDAAIADLRGRGVPLVSGPTDVRPGLRIAFFEGPDRVRIEILERGAAVSGQGDQTPR